jgi:hypothetical protein
MCERGEGILKGWGAFRKAISSYRYHHTMLVANFQGSPSQTTIIYVFVLMLNPGNWPHCSARNRYRLEKSAPALRSKPKALSFEKVSL